MYTYVRMYVCIATGWVEGVDQWKISWAGEKVNQGDNAACDHVM
jgi:hypothetical protein